MKQHRKKADRYRGSKTHGCGSMKKRRGAGNRGGRGMAGTGKRGDGKKPSIWKNTKYFGVHGFKQAKKERDSVNLAYIEGRVETWAKEGKVENKGGFFDVELSKLGYSKLLAKGSVTRKYRITCDLATSGAIEKIKKAGGEVTTNVQTTPDESA